MTSRRRLQLGRAVLAHVQRTRRQRRRDRERFPLTGEYVQRALRRFGVIVGEHAAYAIVHELLAAGAITPAGSYRQRYNLRQPSGWRVPLFRVAVLLRTLTSSVRRTRGKTAAVCWRHPLFGDPALLVTVPRHLRTWREPPPWSKDWPDELREQAR